MYLSGTCTDILFPGGMHPREHVLALGDDFGMEDLRSWMAILTTKLPETYPGLEVLTPIELTLPKVLEIANGDTIRNVILAVPASLYWFNETDEDALARTELVSSRIIRKVQLAVIYGHHRDMESRRWLNNLADCVLHFERMSPASPGTTVRLVKDAMYPTRQGWHVNFQDMFTKPERPPTVWERLGED